MVERYAKLVNAARFIRTRTWLFAHSPLPDQCSRDVKLKLFVIGFGSELLVIQPIFSFVPTHRTATRP
jgi:hypothetical protein